MSKTVSDILVIGGGVAGLSAAAELSRQAKVTVLEGEDSVGFHSSGRSATMLHYFLGNRLVRLLTLSSRSFFQTPRDDLQGAALAEPLSVLVHGRGEEKADIDALEAEIAPFAPIERLDADGLAAASPLLRVGPGGSEHGLIDRDAFKLDGHALLQIFLRTLQRNQGGLQTGARIAVITRSSGSWTVTTERGEQYQAPVLVNAAGAWADRVAELAGVPTVGLQPMRRTIIVFDAPSGTELESLPFTKTVGDELYFGREGGRLFASPMDEIPTDPCDAQADEYEMALAAHRMEERTTATVRRIEHRWAGLRTFAPDRHPVVGFAPEAEGFFWLAGQGGAGLQTAPTLARIAASLILGEAWPVPEIDAGELSPVRVLRKAA